MNQHESNIYSLLCNWHKINAEKRFVEARMHVSSSQIRDRLALINSALTMLESWMRLLSDDERYVIKRHLLDGIAWYRIAYEYNTKLIRSKTKSLSSLRRMQRRAIARIALHTQGQGKDVEHAISTFISGQKNL